MVCMVYSLRLGQEVEGVRDGGADGEGAEEGRLLRPLLPVA